MIALFTEEVPLKSRRRIESTIKKHNYVIKIMASVQIIHEQAFKPFLCQHPDGAITNHTSNILAFMCEERLQC